MNGLFGTFDYDTWLSTEPDYCIHEDAEDEDEAYDRWKDEQASLWIENTTTTTLTGDNGTLS